MKDLGPHCAFLSLTEVGLGGLLHNFKIPLTGHFLSLNQIFILARGSLQSQRKKAGAEISTVVAILKSLSPMGKKLTPMLGISMQGILFSLGTMLFGINFFGLLVGGVLASLWGFVQPLLLLYLLFGEQSINVTEFYLNEWSKFSPVTLEIIWFVVFGVIILKILLAMVLISIAPYAWGDALFRRQEAWAKIKTINLEHKNNASPFKSAMKDLCHPLFIVSFLLSFIFLFLAQVSWSKMIWLGLRPVAIGFVLFYLVRIFPIGTVVLWLEKKGFTAISSLLSKTLALLKNKKDS